MAEILLKGKKFHTNGQLPSLGSQAPDFLLVDKELTPRSLKDYHGKRKLLSIVPSLDTPVCALSAQKFNEVAQQNPHIVVLVISADLPFAQKRTCAESHLSNVHTLSMIRSKEFAKAYGVLIEDGPLEGLCARAVVVLSEENRVVYTELVSEVTDEPSYEKALRALGEY